MTDLEMTKLCAEMMELEGHAVREGREMWTLEGWERNKDAIMLHHGKWQIWNPLHDDAQAMALVKKFPVLVLDHLRHLFSFPGAPHPVDLNRAIVECVAKIQKSKT